MASKEVMVGVDVSAQWLDVSRQRGTEVRAARFANRAAGHRQHAQWVTKGGGRTRVVLEATGTYSFDVAFALHAHKRVSVMVANPRAVKQFRDAWLQRARTDASSAEILCEFGQRMPFVAWQPPTPAALELRALARRWGPWWRCGPRSCTAGMRPAPRRAPRPRCWRTTGSICASSPHVRGGCGSRHRR